MMKRCQAPTVHLDLARRSMVAIWYPYTQMQCAAAVLPLAVLRGEGPWLFDDTGRRYFETSSSGWVNLFGHADARINAALKAQLDTHGACWPAAVAIATSFAVNTPK